MRNSKHLAARMVVVVAVVTLAGASAFAESRPTNETRRRSDGSGVIRRDGVRDDAQVSRGDDSRNARVDSNRPAAAERSDRSPRAYDRSDRGDRNDRGNSNNRGDAGRTRETARDNGRYDRNHDNSRSGRNNDDRHGNDGRYDRNDNGRHQTSRDSRSNGTWRNDSRSSSRGGSYRHDNRRPYYASGRVSRVAPYNGGYRVWVGGAPYPFFVPSRYYHRDRFRIGVVINLGGYYNDGGYYDYYDGRDYSSSRGDLRGTVESVDYRRDTFVIRNDASGSFVTVVSRDLRDVRPGDYVEVSGDWTRNGIFRAYDVDLLDSYRR